MTDENLGIPFLLSIGLSVTTSCPAACSHCIINAGPGQREEMTLEDARKWINQAALYRNKSIKSIVITGGEPFYNFSLLSNITKYIVELDIVPVVITNAYWADSIDKACRILNAIPGTKMLCISTDYYHQKFIPIDNIKNAIIASEKLKIAYNIAVSTEDENNAEFLNLMEDLKKITDPKLIRVTLVYPAGRAFKKNNKNEMKKTKSFSAGSCSAADAPTIFPDGSVIGCMGIIPPINESHPLMLGNLHKKSLAEILEESEINVVLHMIRIWGPGEIMKILEKNGHADKLPKEFYKDRYCDFCYSLLKNNELLNALKSIVSSKELLEKTAYARQFYLKEDEMIKKLEII